MAEYPPVVTFAPDVTVMTADQLSMINNAIKARMMDVPRKAFEVYKRGELVGGRMTARQCWDYCLLDTTEYDEYSDAACVYAEYGVILMKHVDNDFATLGDVYEKDLPVSSLVQNSFCF